MTKSVHGQVQRAHSPTKIHSGHVWCVEMNEYQPNENKQRLFIQSLLFIAGSQHHHLRLAETQRQAEERKSFAEKKRKASGVPRFGAVGLGKP